MITREQIEKTTAEWETQNPTLAADVIGIEVTTTGYNRFKRGNGVTAWANLAYLDKVPPSTSSGGGDLDISVVDNRIALHNGSEAAHNDLRALISGLDVLVSELGTRLNAIADSDDVDLDQFSEIVAFIKSNRSIIEQVTTLKVNYTDIINNLTTDLADKPLSAAQGVALKALIDGITVPTKVSAFDNDVPYLTEHQDISGKLDSKDLLNKVYPVGSIYMSTSNTDPSTFIGGTWVQLKDRFLLGAGDTYTAGNTGGAATHTLTIDEMPSHSHKAKGWAAVVDGSGNYITLGGNGSSDIYSTRDAGGGKAHNNMPPYITVYMWKRTK